ncbi:MAG: hypothetical protein ACJAV4_000172 [Pontimonas sp.]|jgi:hypothetical protein
MANTFTLASHNVLGDLQTFVQRAIRVNNGSARVIVSEGLLQVYVGILLPRGLLDRTPTVLGLRVSPLAHGEDRDAIVTLESLQHRIGVAWEAPNPEVTVPAEVASLAWSSITPPRHDWRLRKEIASTTLADAARSGIARVAEAVPESAGEAIVQKVRAEVWGEMVPHRKIIPAGAGFAADALGFLSDKNLQVHSRGTWVRLSSSGGYVLVKFPTGYDFGPDDEDD